MENRESKASAALVGVVQNAQDSGFSEKNWEKIKKCIERGANPNHTFGKNECRLLHAAIRQSNRGMLDYLIVRRADVNACGGEEGDAPIHLAIRAVKTNRENFDIQIVQKLLKHKANANVFDKSACKETPLYMATEAQHVDLIKLLIKYRADVNLGKYYTPLFAANNYVAGAIELCNAGASLVNVTFYGHTAFHFAYPHLIEKLMTHARFDSHEEVIDQERGKEIEAAVITALLVFNRFSISDELKFLILSKLPVRYFHGANMGLCKKLFDEGYKHPYILAQVNKRVVYLGNILQNSNNHDKKMAWEFQQQKQLFFSDEFASLLNGTRLQSDSCDFNAVFPNMTLVSDGNLVGQMYRNCKKLMDKEENSLVSLMSDD